MRTVKPDPNSLRAASTYGRGSVEVLPSGRRRVSLMVDGERVRQVVDTAEEAEALRVALVAERAEGDRKRAAALPPEPEVLTLARWGETWLKRREARVRWFANDKSRWKLYVAPAPLASMPLAEVRPKHVKAWLADLSTTKREGELLNTRTVRHVLNLVRCAFGNALDEELIAANPAVGVKVPKRPGTIESGPREFLTVDEIRAVEACEAIPETPRLLYAVAIYTGLREGELIALRWGDVREGATRAEVVVRWSHDDAPKNGKVQPVPLLPQACAAFARLRALATVDGRGPGDDELVFPSPRGSQRQPSDDFGWSSRKVHGRPRVGHRELAKVNPRVTFHGLRHTCGSHLLIGTFGVTLTLAEVRDFLRHEDVTTTDGYAHLMPGHLHERIASLNAAAKVAAAAPAVRPEAPSATVGNVAHAGPLNSAHAALPDDAKPLVFRARDTGFEPVALGFGDPRSIQLS